MDLEGADLTTSQYLALANFPICRKIAEMYLFVVCMNLESKRSKTSKALFIDVTGRPNAYQ